MEVNEPKPVDVPVNAPKPVTVEVNAPKPVDVPVNAPKPVTVEVNAPKPVDVPVNEPEPVKIPVEQPDAVKVPIEEPKSVKVPVVGPKPVKILIEKPKPVKIPIENLHEAEHAAKNLRNLGDVAGKTSTGMMSAVKAFSGMAISLAASYAASRMEPGSTGQRVVGAAGTIAGSAITGAAVGSAVPGIGTAAGAAAGTVVGAGKAAVDWSAADDAAKKEKEDALRSIETWERARAETLAFKKQLDELTDAERSLSERMSTVTAEIERRKEIDKNLAETQRWAVANGKDAHLAEANRRRQANASEMDALTAALKQMVKQDASDGAASHGPTDALSRVGGYFANGSAGTDLRDIARTGKEQLSVLKKIEAKSGKGATWQ